MLLQKFIPSPQLQPYIQQYYLVEGDFGGKTCDVFFADGCLEIVFNLDIDFYRNNEKEHWAKLIGQITQPLHVKAKGRGKSFGIWFSPQGFSMFSKTPIQELNDKAIPLDSIFDNDFIDFVGSCLLKDDNDTLIQGINLYFEKLISKSSNTRKENVVDHVIGQFRQFGHELSLDDLARDCQISQRYLQKIFLEKTGIGPKQFQKILRFQQALGQVASGQKDNLTAIAYQSGYFDQSHFIREFKGFAGFAPSQYALKNHPINQYFLNS